MTQNLITKCLAWSEITNVPNLCKPAAMQFPNALECSISRCSNTIGPVQSITRASLTAPQTVEGGKWPILHICKLGSQSHHRWSLSQPSMVQNRLMNFPADIFGDSSYVLWKRCEVRKLRLVVRWSWGQTSTHSPMKISSSSSLSSSSSSLSEAAGKESINTLLGVEVKKLQPSTWLRVES